MHQATPTATSYNGWSNRETWLASLWLNNDERSYNLLILAMKAGESDFKQAEWLQSRLHDQLVCEQGEASMWTDLLATAFHRIDWLEVISNNKS